MHRGLQENQGGTAAKKHAIAVMIINVLVMIETRKNASFIFKIMENVIAIRIGLYRTVDDMVVEIRVAFVANGVVKRLSFNDPDKYTIMKKMIE